MVRSFQRYQEASDDNSSEIKISPLIDIVFILLIFFIVTIVFVEETGVDIKKPRAASQNDLEKNSMLLGITPDGKVYYGGKPAGAEKVFISRPKN